MPQGRGERLKRLHSAQEIVVSDPEILSGTPVIRGTRVPVYDVAASVASGIPVDRILATYPSLKREQVELAALYVEANPQRGRPRQKTSLPPNEKVISRRTGTFSKPQRPSSSSTSRGSKGVLADVPLHAGLICIDRPTGMDLDLQRLLSLLEELEAQAPVTRKFLERLPNNKLTSKPSPQALDRWATGIPSRLRARESVRGAQKDHK